MLFICSEAVESNLVKLGISHTVILPLTVSVLRLKYQLSSTLYAEMSSADIVCFLAVGVSSFQWLRQ